ncbi:hypothetical protein [Nocardioides antri]|uniref:PH domain-containing protein n=1 Tax=Nocardioides antri TaxID=2607659 RepID=A0A5B1M4X7_9ACTN|nr:hypothetical protein [Nocardioides antri]KAA1427189.1 hypothetical protein F0U47_06700 [Nocardioides antri]
MADDGTERFTAWGSRVLGIIGLAIVAVVVVVGASGVADPYHPAAYAVCGVVGLLLWAMLVRPSVGVEDDRLVLCNPFTTVRLPLAAIEQVAVRQWLVVQVGARRYTSSGIGRSRRQALRDDRRGGDIDDIADLSYGGFVEHRILKLAEDARTRQGIAHYSEEQEALGADVRREPAWVEIGLLAAFVVALVVTLLV